MILTIVYLPHHKAPGSIILFHEGDNVSLSCPFSLDMRNFSIWVQYSPTYIYFLVGKQIQLQNLIILIIRNHCQT